MFCTFLDFDKKKFADSDWLRTLEEELSSTSENLGTLLKLAEMFFPPICFEYHQQEETKNTE